jgi:hypothetical protein
VFALFLCQIAFKSSQKTTASSAAASNGGVDRSLWRGGLPPLGSEAAPKDGPAAQSNGGKPPRHRMCGYTDSSILSSTPFAVISATMMLLEIPNKA